MKSSFVFLLLVLSAFAFAACAHDRQVRERSAADTHESSIVSGRAGMRSYYHR